MAMPQNPTAGMLMTVLAQLNAAQQALRFQNAFLRRIYWDMQPVVAVPFQTLNATIPIVNEANVVNIGAGPLQPAPYAFTVVPITLSQNQSNSYVVYDWDQARIQRRLQELFFQPKLEELVRSINRIVVSQFTPANFPSYPLVPGSGTVPGQITRDDITTAWTNLASAGVPMDDTDNVTLMIQPVTYGKMLADQQFLYQYIVGQEAAVAAQQRAQLRTVYGADIFYDQQLQPFNPPKAAAILFHRYAVCGVTALPPEGGPQVIETTIKIFGILPARIQVGYDLLSQGWVVHMHVLFGIAAVRPEMGSTIQTGA